MSMKINIPSKVMAASVTDKFAQEPWPYDDGSGDPYWDGGSSPLPYKWRIIMNVTEASHGSHLTREKFKYNGLDVNVGDWIAGATSGIALKIIEVIAKDETVVECVIEDVLRYNTFRTPTSVTGIFPVPGQAVIFQLNEEGSPKVDPVPVAVTSADFPSNLSSRFNNFNLQYNYILEKTAHSFVTGDAVSINTTTNEFDLTSSVNTTVIGTVVEPGPGPNFFILRPTTKIVDFVPALPGEPGDTVFVDPATPGKLTLSNTGRPIFIKLTDSIPSVSLSDVPDATTSPSNELLVNGVPVTIGGTGDLTSVESAINALTSSHGVTATVVPAPTTVETSLTLVYGLVGAFTDSPGPASATINGSLVTFSTNTEGQAQYAQNVSIQEDMANDINAAGIPNITATFDASKLYITDSSGGSITIVNSNNDFNGNPYAGNNSCSGLPLSTPASTQSFIKLERADGGGITLQNSVGTPREDIGLVSVENGKFPLALQVEEGLRQANTYVVADIPSRDSSLSPLIGDQVMVLDTGNNEWGMYLWDGSAWVLIGDQDSAATDANTLSITITPSSSATELIGTVSTNSRISLISVEVTQAFDGTPTLDIGDVSDNDRLMSDNILDLSSVGSYSTQSDHFYDSGSDTDINAYFSAGGSTVGEAVIVVSYL